MKEKDRDSFIIRSGGRRIELYAELGQYFRPDGELDVLAFKSAVKEHVQRLKREVSEEMFFKRCAEWFSSYLENALSYLLEKSLVMPAYRLLEAGLEEAGSLHIDRLDINPLLIKEILAQADTERRPQQSRKHDPEGKKQRIFEAALEEFAEKGFHDATMDSIASKAGVAKGTLYRLFESKEDLLNELLIEKNHEIISVLIEIFSKSDKDIIGQIQEAIERYVDFIEKNHVLYRLIQSEAIVKRSKSQSMFYDYLISNLPMFKERIVSLNKQGVLKTTSFYTVWYGMLGFIDGVVHKWFRSGIAYPLRDEIPIIMEVMFNGFVGEKTTGRRFYIPPEEKNSSR